MASTKADWGVIESGSTRGCLTTKWQPSCCSVLKTDSVSLAG